MAQQTICPACGAPIQYEGHQDEVHCTFCGADLQVIREDGQERFQVLGQPGPQKEVLSNPVEVPGDVSQGGAAIYNIDDTVTPAPIGNGASIYPDNSQPTFQANPAPDPWSSGLPAGASPSFETPASYTPISGAPATPARTGINRWIIIAVAALAGLCVLCACLGLVAMAVYRSR
jgi:hypothetical protein